MTIQVDPLRLRLSPQTTQRRAHQSAEAQLVFRHFARVLEKLVPPDKGPPPVCAPAQTPRIRQA